jgi:hypothetical protein
MNLLEVLENLEPEEKKALLHRADAQVISETSSFSQSCLLFSARIGVQSSASEISPIKTKGQRFERE